MRLRKRCRRLCPRPRLNVSKTSRTKKWRRKNKSSRSAWKKKRSRKGTMMINVKTVSTTITDKRKSIRCSIQRRRPGQVRQRNPLMSRLRH